MALAKLTLHPLDKYLRTDRLPHIWCPGCGIGIALGAMLRAIDRRINEGKLDRNKVVFVTGIGCSARVSFYVDFDSAHTLHGRAIPFATGVKLANPSLEVIVVGGDGDIAGIGGNHLLHAAKRNIDLFVVMITNFVYAMTGGQLAPTTPLKVYTTTTPHGNPEPPLNVVKLVASLNANYVARASITTPHYIEMFTYKALGMRGFRFLEVISTCPEVYGRHIGLRNPVTMFEELKKRVKYKPNPVIDESDIDWEKGIVIGEYVVRNNPSYLDLVKRG
ncbi:thiamine pyrophosphate-dependent enzyme [Thermogladius sp.]|uniref:thiamine pyrophosphate-dependent enzyme n=1 Tax=Thermogladius sp. TaxID=2023064 RepID=UPI003D103E7B